MFERLVYLGVFTIYSALVGSLLVFYDASVLVVAFFLLLLPLVLLWRVEHLKTRIIPIIGVSALTITLLLEVIAYHNGLWYELAPWHIRVFGLVPLEALIAGFFQVLFVVVAYEFWFDDGKSSQKKTYAQSRIVLGIGGILVAVAFAYIHVFSGVFFSYPFAVLIAVGFIIFAILLALTHQLPLRVLQKSALFATAILPAFLILEYVMLENELRFFANSHEYLYNVPFFGLALPLEEVLLTWLMPFWIAVLYELYLDDRQ
ncbi:MAG: hypothetical protein R3B69_02220 [Candidatus Paceibacterota bacterium]